MESVSSIHYQLLKVHNHRFPLLPGHRRCHSPPSHRLRHSRTATTRFPSLSVFASSSSTSLPPRREPASLPDLLLATVKPVLISLTAATAVLLATPILHRASSLALALAAWPQPATSASMEGQQRGKGASATDEEQERALESKLRASPEDQDALRGLLELRLRQEREPDVIALADRLAALDPGDTGLLLLRAFLHNGLGDTNSSRAAFEEIIQKDPLVVEAYHGLLILAVEAGEENLEGEVEKVRERVEAALTRCREEGRTEEMTEFRMLLAEVRFIEGELEVALQGYEELVKEQPSDFRPYGFLGVIYTIMGKDDEAAKQVDQYRKLIPKGDPRAHFFEGILASLIASRKQMTGNKRN